MKELIPAFTLFEEQTSPIHPKEPFVLDKQACYQREEGRVYHRECFS